MNVFTTFHGHPSNSCEDDLLRTTNVNVMVALEEKSGDQKSHYDSSGHHECPPDFILTHPIAVKIIYSDLKRH